MVITESRGACAHTTDGFFNDDIFDVLYRIFDMTRGGYSTVDLTGKRAVITNSHVGDMSLAQVATQLGITQERVRQIEKGALQKLRRPTTSKMLESFL